MPNDVSSNEFDQTLAQYKAICRGLDHEAKVMSDRITWAIVYSAGLFAASAIMINILVATEGVTAAAVVLILTIMCGISLTGVVFSLFCIGGVHAAQGQFNDIKEHCERLRDGFEKFKLVRPFGNPNNHQSGHRSARVFPYLMLVAWMSAFAVEGLVAVVWLSPDIVENVRPIFGLPGG